MIPRFITPLEQEYDRTFPGNPATLFYPGTAQEASFFEMLRKAIDRNAPLTKEEMLQYLGEEGYRQYKEYLEAWYEMTITWPEDTHADPH